MGASVAYDQAVLDLGRESSPRTGVPASKKPALEPRPIATAYLRRLVAALLALAQGRKNSLDYHMGVAKRVVDDIYDGKLEAFRSEGADGPSFRDLARDLSGAITKTTLHRALSAYEVRETTPVYVVPDAVPGVSNATGAPTLEQLILAGVPTLERLSPDERDRLYTSHFYEVRGLAIPLRSDLLSQAVHGRWSVRRLRREIEARVGSPSRIPRILELLRQLGNLPATVDLTPLASLSKADALHYRCVLQKVDDFALRARAALQKSAPAKGSV